MAIIRREFFLNALSNSWDQAVFKRLLADEEIQQQKIISYKSRS